MQNELVVSNFIWNEAHTYCAIQFSDGSKGTWNLLSRPFRKPEVGPRHTLTLEQNIATTVSRAFQESIEGAIA